MPRPDTQFIPEDEQHRPERDRRTGMRMSWVLLAIVAVAATVPFLMASRPKDRVAWLADYDAALAAARQANKPVLVDFTAEWCGYCRAMKQAVFSQTDVKQVIETNFVPLRVDLTRKGEAETRLGRRFGVSGLPTFVILGADGQERGRHVGSMSRSQMIQWLESYELAQNSR